MLFTTSEIEASGDMPLMGITYVTHHDLKQYIYKSSIRPTHAVSLSINLVRPVIRSCLS